MAVITVPPRQKSNLFEQMLAQMYQDESEKKQLEQQESQFSRTHGENVRVNDAQIDELGARKQAAAMQGALAAYTQLSAQAKAFMAPYEAEITRSRESGDDPSGMTANQRINALVANAASVPELQGDPALRGEVMRGIQALAFITSQPSLATDIQKGLVNQGRNRALTATQEGGGISAGNLNEQNLAFSQMHPKNEQISTQAMPGYQAMTQGPAAVAQQAGIASGTRVSATDAAKNATDLERQRIANQGALDQEKIRAGAQERSSATTADVARQTKMELELGPEMDHSITALDNIIRIADQLIGAEGKRKLHPGFKSAVGAHTFGALGSGGRYPFTDKALPFAQDTAAAEALFKSLSSVMTLPELKYLKPVSEFDVPFAEISTSPFIVERGNLGEPVVIQEIERLRRAARDTKAAIQGRKATLMQGGDGEAVEYRRDASGSPVRVEGGGAVEYRRDASGRLVRVGGGQ